MHSGGIGKKWTRNNSVFGHFSRRVRYQNNFLMILLKSLITSSFYNEDEEDLLALMSLCSLRANFLVCKC